MRKTALYLGGLFFAAGAALAVSAPAQAAPSTSSCISSYSYCPQKSYYPKPSYTSNYGKQSVDISQGNGAHVSGKYVLNVNEANVSQNQNVGGTQYQAGDDIFDW